MNGTLSGDYIENPSILNNKAQFTKTNNLCLKFYNDKQLRM